MLRVGITGQSGFVGTNFAKFIDGQEECCLVPFEDAYFDDAEALRGFCAKSDVILHLAGVSRLPSGDEALLYATNMGINRKLVDALNGAGFKGKLMFASSVHETRDTAYGRAKRDGCEFFAEWARGCGASFTAFVFPNVYGPGARPFYCSFIANFAYQLQHGQEPSIQVDAAIDLVYIRNLCEFIKAHFEGVGIEKVPVPKDMTMKVSEVLRIFQGFAAGAGALDANERNLLETFNYYRDYVI